MAKEIQEKNERFLASMGRKAGQKGEKGVASGEKGVASTTSRVGAAPAAAQEDQAVPSAEAVDREVRDPVLGLREIGRASCRERV